MSNKSIYSVTYFMKFWNRKGSFLHSLQIFLFLEEERGKANTDIFLKEEKFQIFTDLSAILFFVKLKFKQKKYIYTNR